MRWLLIHCVWLGWLACSGQVFAQFSELQPGARIVAPLPGRNWHPPVAPVIVQPSPAPAMTEPVTVVSHPQRAPEDGIINAVCSAGEGVFPAETGIRTVAHELPGVIPVVPVVPAVPIPKIIPVELPRPVPYLVQVVEKKPGPWMVFMNNFRSAWWIAPRMPILRTR